MFYILFFILGSVMGSFFHVVATRMSNDESIITPSSHCHICDHKLKWYELIPIVSYIIQGGKCRKCGSYLPLSYLVIEIVTGILYAVCYHEYGLSPELVISIIFISILIIVIVSDIEYMIILDEVLVFGSVITIIFYLILEGLDVTVYHVLDAALAFVAMYALKLLGDFMFKKESLGGGDIKLMFFFGLVIGLPLSVVTIFVATFIAFPIALFILFSRRDNMIPFGPFLSMAAILILISGVDINDIINVIVNK